MKKNVIWVILLFFAGCASVNIPNYIKDENPYKKRIYSDFDQVLNAASKSLGQLHWKISGTSDPAVYEKTKEIRTEGGKQTLLFASRRQRSLFLFTNYGRLNVFLRTGAEPAYTEVEIRYASVSSVMFKSLYKYKNDRAVKKIFSQIEENLKLQ